MFRKSCVVSQVSGDASATLAERILGVKLDEKTMHQPLETKVYNGLPNSAIKMKMRNMEISQRRLIRQQACPGRGHAYEIIIGAHVGSMLTGASVLNWRDFRASS